MDGLERQRWYDESFNHGRDWATSELKGARSADEAALIAADLESKLADASAAYVGRTMDQHPALADGLQRSDEQDSFLAQGFQDGANDILARIQSPAADT